MKRISIILILVGCLGMTTHVHAQKDEIQQLLLNWEKLRQLEEILDNMYKGYKILDKGYRTIRDISKGNYSIHQAFLDGLMAVNPSMMPFMISTS